MYAGFKPELRHFYNLPFLNSAVDYIKEHGIEIDRILSPDYEEARKRALERIKQALEGEIEKTNLGQSKKSKIENPEFESEIEVENKIKIKMENELFSYPIARAILSCIKDNYLIRRYAVMEAKASHNFIRNWLEEIKNNEGLERRNELTVWLCKELDIDVKEKEGIFVIHFSDYIRLSNTIGDPSWRLINRSLKRGMLKLTHPQLLRIIQEAIRQRVQHGLPLDVPANFCKSIELDEIIEELEKRKEMYGEIEYGPERFYPPCMRNAIRLIRESINISHTLRFALTSFLLSIGWDRGKILDLFRNLPDFDEKLASYQIEHIAGSTGTVYTPPSCKTMETYGNCVGRDKLCIKVKHPLSYYRVRLRKEKYEKRRQKSNRGD
ncbi:DNA primase regulatory subunit PriL [Methanosarcinales archaeon]|nr:MAG: DNA primase regulatory subunit PriL [Methanosarcinales archaeon]